MNLLCNIIIQHAFSGLKNFHITEFMEPCEVHIEIKESGIYNYI